MAISDSLFARPEVRDALTVEFRVIVPKGGKLAEISVEAAIQSLQRENGSGHSFNLEIWLAENVTEKFGRLMPSKAKVYFDTRTRKGLMNFD